jgi:hypothetical protein
MSSRSLQLHINSGGRWLVDTALGGVQVGQAFQAADGSWSVEFEGGFVEAPDLDAALRLVVDSIRSFPCSDWPDGGRGRLGQPR